MSEKDSCVSQSRTEYLTGYEPGMIYISVSLRRDVGYQLGILKTIIYSHEPITYNQ